MRLLALKAWCSRSGERNDRRNKRGVVRTLHVGVTWRAWQETTSCEWRHASFTSDSCHWKKSCDSVKIISHCSLLYKRSCQITSFCIMCFDYLFCEIDKHLGEIVSVVVGLEMCWLCTGLSVGFVHTLSCRRYNEVYCPCTELGENSFSVRL